LARKDEGSDFLAITLFAFFALVTAA
jgi:hypothetical protein